MFPFKFSVASFIGDVTSTKSTLMVAAVVLGAVVVPLSGGSIKPYEVREVRAAFGIGEAAAEEPAVYPRRHVVTLTSAALRPTQVLATAQRTELRVEETAPAEP